MRIRRLPLLLIMAATLSACGREVSQSSVLAGRVTKVTDGDTIEVELPSGRFTIQLDSIDAPERDQPNGQAATVALSELIASGQVELEVITQDRYDRLVAVVYAGGVNVNERMVKNGHAWAYGQHLKDHEYCVWERAARNRRKGLWRLPSEQRIAPWEWRAIERGRGSVAGRCTGGACYSRLHLRNAVKGTSSRAPTGVAIGRWCEPRPVTRRKSPWSC